MNQKVFTRPFWLLCISSFLFMMSFNLIIPELNQFIADKGGENLKGFNIALFAMAALICRPLSGRLTDTIGRVPVMVTGAVICFLMGFVYNWFTSLSAYLVIRFLHGFSTGFKPTATTAYLADITPDGRKGEALGILGISGTLGMSAGPPVGSFIANHFSVEAMFYASSFVAILSILVLAGMKETLEGKSKFRASSLRIQKQDIMDPGVLWPSLIMLMNITCFGIILVIIPDMTDMLGIQNRGTFFPVYLTASIIVRIFAGKASDRYGREKMMLWGMSFMTIAMIVLAMTETLEMFLLGGILFGIAAGINSPTLFAWTIDLGDKRFVGRAMSTLFIALEGGIIIGSLSANFIYQNNYDNIPYIFWFGSFMAATGLFLLLRRKAIQQR